MKTIRNFYRSLLLASGDNDFGLPLNAILFVESSWNFHLNRYVHDHRAKIEQLLQNYLDGCFPYHLIIVPTAPNDLSQEMLERNWHFTALQRQLGRGEPYEVSFIARIATQPHQRPYGFYSIDVSLTGEDLILDVLNDFLHQLTDYHRASLSARVDWFHASVQEHTVQRPPSSLAFCGMQHGPLPNIHHLVEPLPTDNPPTPQEKEHPADPQLVAQLLEIRDQIASCQQSNDSNTFLRKQLRNFNRYIQLLIPHSTSISPIVIATCRGKNSGTVTLTEYGKIIPLTPLRLLVYVLFLRHPEGLYLKDISMYRAELYRWYPVLNQKSIRKTTIEHLLDTSSNSLNETISHINRAFTDLLPSDLASYYTINGQRGGIYSLNLPADKVTYPEQLTKFF